MTISKNFCRLFVPGFLVASPALLFGNPTGGAVTSGAATIVGQGTANLNINQTSNAAIINWQGFSVNTGEITQFNMPGSQSAVLNRVLGGGVSTINGQLLANGQLYLVNQNGIVVGPGGLINAASFTGSTRDIADADFLNGNLHFLGNSSGGILNQGTINAGLGDVSLIGKTVENQGKIKAPNGTAALVAGDDVLLGQKNADGSTVIVNPSPLATSVSSTTVGVKNSGIILSTAAELKAAGGNIYALAINNSGTIRATTSTKQGGHIWLTSSGGSLVNTGTLNASAKVAKGTGGTVVLKNTGGTTTDSGKILAKGGTGGTGGNAEVSGEVVQYSGTVDLTAAGGKTGNLLFDPFDVYINSGLNTGNTNFTAGSNDSIFYDSDIEAALLSANVTVSTGSSGTQFGDITVATPLTWSSGNTLALSAANNIFLNADITPGSGGSLTLSAGNSILSGNETTSGSITANISVNSFVLQSGSWFQNSPSLPLFQVSNSFSTYSGTNFLRFTGGNGSAGNPYQITDVYGLAGMGSTSLLNDSFALVNSIDASTTANWSNPVSGTGFQSIGSAPNPFNGTFDGQGNSITNLSQGYPYDSTAATGLFGVTGGSSVIKNVNLVGGSFSGYYVGALVGLNQGLITNCTSSS